MKKTKMITDDFHALHDAYQRSKYDYVIDSWIVVIGFIVGFIALLSVFFFRGI